MKPVHGHITPDQSCSCTSCLYKSGSDRPSLKRFVTHGSKIDRLYYNEYLPLRERKLLVKLIKTRALYDDVRKQILSDSSFSSDKADLKPMLKKTSRNKQLDVAKRNSNIISLVALVDKGAVPSTKNLSECCSCCVCDSNISSNEAGEGQIYGYKNKRRQTYSRGYPLARKRLSRIIDNSKHKLRRISEMGKNVQFKAKYVRSDPCTCTFKFSDLIKPAAKVTPRGTHNKNTDFQLDETKGIEQNVLQQNTRKNIIRQSIQNVKRSRLCLCNNIEDAVKNSAIKLKRSASKLKDELKEVKRKSMEELKLAKFNTMEKFGSPKQKIQSLVSGDEEQTKRITFKIRKDSLTKFREKIKRQRDRKYWQCDFECIPDECVPEQCLKIMKRKRLRNDSEKRLKHNTKLEKKVGELWGTSDISVQAQESRDVMNLDMKKQKYKAANTYKKSATVGHNFDIKKTMDTNKNNFKYSIKKNVNPRTERMHLVPNTKSRQSMTRFSDPNSKVLTRSVSSRGDVTRTFLSESDKNVKTGEKNGLKNRRSDIESVKDKQPLTKNRQAVRVGSSFSFNIEFYKDKASKTLLNKNLGEHDETKIPEVSTKPKSNTVHIKQNNHRPKNANRHYVISKPVQKHIALKNVQASGHPLKKCFCTLKLKAKKTKMYVNRPHKHKSIQTINTNSAQYILLPYECEPNICVPAPCDPANCKRLIEKRNIKSRYISTNSGFRTKSVASITSQLISNATSKKIQVKSVKNPERSTLSTVPAVINVSDSYKPQKQAVRIGSSFNFSIEFSKDHPSATPSNKNIQYSVKPEARNYNREKREKSLVKTKKLIRHKYSQISNSSAKSRNTSTKYKLRKCFCSLKFHKPERKNVYSISKSTVMSNHRFNEARKLHPISKSASINTEKRHNLKKIKLLPYECEPGVCVPNECDPYKCQIILKARQPRHLKGKSRKLNSISQKTKSTASLTSDPIKLTKTKKVQSAFITNKNEVPNNVPKKTISVSQLLNKSQLHNTSSKQAVRIGSTFSFNIEFYKEKPPGIAYNLVSRPERYTADTVNIHQPPKSIQRSKKTISRDQSLNVQRRSVQIQVQKERKNVQISTAIKRCLCKLKFNKTPKSIRKYHGNDIGTKTPQFNIKAKSQIQAVSQNTMTKDNYNYIRHLEPFECEPYVCMPGECDPYKCLERIKLRNRKLYNRERFSKDIGTVTTHAVLKSSSSSARDLEIPKKNAFIQSNVPEKQIRTKKPISNKIVPQSNESYSARLENLRQAVKIGSKFNFDIEFYKNSPLEHRQLKTIQNKIKEKREPISKMAKNRGNQPISVSVNYHETQTSVNKTHKSTGAALLERCFCTIKLRNKRDTNENKVQSLFPAQPLQVYHVSRFITKNITPAILTGYNKCDLEERNKHRKSKKYCCNDEMLDKRSVPTIYSLSLVTFKTKYFSSNCNESDYQTLKKSLSSKYTVFHSNSKQSIKLNDLLSSHRSSTCNKTSNIIQAIRNNCPIKGNIKNDVNDDSESFTTQQPSTFLERMSIFSNRNFYAMNMQIASQNKPILYKLEPYECEPGVCNPYECDPQKCLELINKRLLKSTSRSSRTENAHVQRPKYTPSTKYKKSRKMIKSEVLQTSQNIVKRGSKQTKTVNTMQNKASQSINMTVDNMTSDAVLKKCFCTLKLKKRREKKSVVAAETQTYIPPVVNNEDVKLKTTNFAQNTKNMSFCCTKNGKRQKKCDKRVQKKTPEFRCKCKSSDSTKSSNYSKKKSSNDKPSRQAVRIGSNFSFNVEFSKENATIPRNVSRKSKLESTPKFFDKTINSVQKRDKHYEQYKEGVSKNKNPNFVRKTMTNSLLKRCFCVANLFQRQKIESGHQKKKTILEIKPEPHKSQSFLERCYCAFKSKATVMRDISKNVNNTRPSVSSQNDIVEKELNNMNRFRKLEPYECEPGICTPGLCDPYSCERLIKNRNVIGVTDTTEHRNKPMNSITGSISHKNGGINFKKQKVSNKRIRNPTATNEWTMEKSVKEVYPSKMVYNYRKKNSSINTEDTIDKMRNKGSSKKNNLMKNIDIQAMTVKKESKASEVDNFLQRCFCTRALQKHNLKKKSVAFLTHCSCPAVKSIQVSNKNVMTVGSNVPYTLQPYECEPYICVPDLCDPLECEKLIKKRLQKESGIHSKSKHKRDYKLNEEAKSKRSIKINTSQTMKQIRNKDSKVRKQSVQSTRMGVKPFLKRCLCVLKLQKREVPRIKINTIAVGPDVRGNSDTTPKIDIPKKSNYKTNIVDKNVTVMNLEPYECEPGVCIPGECNPYECEKRIKERNIKKASKSSYIGRPENFNKYTSARTRSTTKKCQASIKQKCQKEHVKKRPSRYIRQPLNHGRQAVRIGSSFSINIEFYKDKDAKKPYPPLKMKDATNGNGGINFHHRQSQVHRATTESKKSGVRPMNRCFCTLKLQKTGKYTNQQHDTVKIKKSLTKSTHTETDGFSKKYNKNADAYNIQKLETYECVPRVCDRGICDPNVCDRLLKKNRKQDMHNRFDKEPVSILASKKRKSKSVKIQTQSQKRVYRKNDPEKISRKYKLGIYRASVEALNDQAVRVASNFNTNTDFFNDRLLKQTHSLPVPQKLKNEDMTNNSNTKSLGASTKKCQASRSHRCQRKRGKKDVCYGRLSQASRISIDSKGPGISTKYKRCFCTLALQKKSGIPNNELKTILKSDMAKSKSAEVSTQTTLKPIIKKAYVLEPYECEPGVCIPGMCNPYECIKIMNRKARSQSRTASTQHKRLPQVSTTSLATMRNLKTKSIQSNHYNACCETECKKLKGLKDEKEPKYKTSGSKASNVKTKQAVKIGSDFGFNIEFFKESTSPKVLKKNKRNKNQQATNQMKIKSNNAKYTDCTCKLVNFRNLKSQSQSFKTKVNESTVGNILNRCFCTAKLHSKASMLNPKRSHVNRVENNAIKQVFKPQQYNVYYQLQRSKKNIFPERCFCTLGDKSVFKPTNSVGTKTKDKYLKLQSKNHKHKKSHLNNLDTENKTISEMETILPYTSYKFNKKPSKTNLIHDKKAKNSNFLWKCGPVCAFKNQCDQDDFVKDKINVRSKNICKCSKKQTDKEKTLERKDGCGKTSACNSLKVVVCRCKEILTKQNKKANKTKSSENKKRCKCMVRKSKGVEQLLDADHLKTSKSERCPAKEIKKEPKKSKSLKISKVYNDNESEIEYAHKNRKYSQFQQGDTGKTKFVANGIKFQVIRNPNVNQQLIWPCLENNSNKNVKASDLYNLPIYSETNKPKNEGNKIVKFPEIEDNIKKKSILKGLSKYQSKENIPNIQHSTTVRDNENKKDSEQKNRNKSFKNNECCPYCSVNRYSNEKNNSRDVIKFPKSSKTVEDVKIVKGKSTTDTTKDHKGRRQKTGTTKQVKDKSKDTEGKQTLKSTTAKHAKNHTCKCSEMYKGPQNEAELLKKGKICSCYSSDCMCAKVIKFEKLKKKKLKAFYKRQKKKADMEKKKKKQAKKQRKRDAKKQRRDFYLRQKRYKIEDAIRYHKRRDLEHYLAHKLRVKNTPDCLIATESVLDLAKLSCTVLEDIGRSTCRALRDPCYTRQRVQRTIKQPSRIWPIVKAAVINCGAPATFKRIIRRCQTISTVKKIRNKLQRNPCTNYLLHIFDKDPRKRMKMKKAQQRLKRQRIPLDFQCSLYMASLRKKPCIKVYFKWPWFYPHFLNLLNVFRQFADIILFLLAAVVWSPCILLTELCRATMCCLLCTG